MKVLLSIFSLDASNGGPTRSTKGLAVALADAKVETLLLSHAPGTVSDGGVSSLQKHGVKYKEGHGNGFLTSLKDCCLILEEVKPDIVHIQGIWCISTHAMNIAAFKAGIPVVISTHGMLAPWALNVKKWKKRIGMFLFQRKDLKRAKAFHATADQEAKDIRALGLNQPIFVVPNGISLQSSKKVMEINEQAPMMRKRCLRTALFLSRLHPDKGLMLLAEAWARIKPKGWQMVVVGPNTCHCREDVESRLKDLGCDKEWIFIGEVDDVRKWDYYASSKLFVHPSKGENFCLSIAEALYANVPVITTKGCPWSDLLERKCGWWIDRNVDALANALREAMALTDEERSEMGARGHELVKEKYSWETIAREMIKGYEMVLAGASRQMATR